MRILMINSIYPTPKAPNVVGGAEIFTRMLAEHIACGGDDVEVIRAANRNDQSSESYNGVTIHSAKVHNIYPPFTQQRKAASRLLWHAIDDWRCASTFVSDRIKTFRPDIVHSNTLTGLTTGVWRVARSHGVPIIHTLHDYYLTCPRCTRFIKGCACKATCLGCELLTIRRRRATSDVDAVVGVSQRTLDIHRDLGLFGNTPIKTVIRNASPVIKINSREWIDGPLVLGFIGRVTEEKGVDLLVKAIGFLPPGAVQLKIAGRSDETDQRRLRALAPAADITFVGFVKAADFYGQVDVVAIPSIWEEPGALVLAEARAAGRPVLATKVGGSPEAVRDGVTGWLSTAEPEEFAKQIEAIAADPGLVRAASRHASMMARERTFDNVVADYRALFHQVAK